MRNLAKGSWKARAKKDPGVKREHQLDFEEPTAVAEVPGRVVDTELHLCPGSWRHRRATIVQVHGNKEGPGLTAARRKETLRAKKNVLVGDVRVPFHYSPQ